MFTPHRLQEINSGIARFATPGKGDFCWVLVKFI